MIVIVLATKENNAIDMNKPTPLQPLYTLQDTVSRYKISRLLIIMYLMDSIEYHIPISRPFVELGD